MTRARLREGIIIDQYYVNRFVMNIEIYYDQIKCCTVNYREELDKSIENGILSGSLIAKLKRMEISEVIQFLPKQPYLATILVGNDPASEVYVSFKEKACNEIGIRNTILRLSSDITQDALIEKIVELNQDPEINGILLQLPLPAHINTTKVLNKISHVKDVDGLNYHNIGKLHAGMNGFVPCTPAGVMVMLEYANIDLKGKNIVVLGRSNLVGKPLARLLELKNATVTLCHSKTQNIGKITRNSDIIISAIGKAGFVTAEMISDGAIIIDVGTNKINGKLVGDVQFDEVSKKASLITPVPGGVGPMTITMLLFNTVYAFKIQN